MVKVKREVDEAEDGSANKKACLASLASTHSCVRDLMERNTFLHGQLRILMREPLSRMLQPKARGFLSRRAWHFGCARARVTKIQAFGRMVATRRNFQEHKTAAIAIQAITRGYVVHVSHVLGKVVSCAFRRNNCKWPWPR